MAAVITALGAACFNLEILAGEKGVQKFNTGKGKY
jgi:hypothetical protein